MSNARFVWSIGDVDLRKTKAFDEDEPRDDHAIGNEDKTLVGDETLYRSIVKAAKDEHEPDLQRSLLHAWGAARRNASASEMRAAVSDKAWGKVANALRRAQDALTRAALQPRLSAAYLRGVELGARPLRRQGVEVRAARPAPISMNPYALSWARDRAGNLLPDEEIVKEQVAALVLEALEEGLTVDEVAEGLLDFIGLDTRRAGALAEYRHGSTAQEAQKYRQELLDSRAMTIARTEIMSATNAGQHGVWMSALDRGLLDETLRRAWIAGEECCEDCELLSQDDPVGLTEDFQAGVTFPPLHPNCRCTVGLVSGADEYPEDPDEE